MLQWAVTPDGNGGWYGVVSLSTRDGDALDVYGQGESRGGALAHAVMGGANVARNDAVMGWGFLATLIPDIVNAVASIVQDVSTDVAEVDETDKRAAKRARKRARRLARLAAKGAPRSVSGLVSACCDISGDDARALGDVLGNPYANPYGASYAAEQWGAMPAGNAYGVSPHSWNPYAYADPYGAASYGGGYPGSYADPYGYGASSAYGYGFPGAPTAFMPGMDPYSGLVMDPMTGALMDPMTGVLYDPMTGMPFQADPATTFSDISVQAPVRSPAGGSRPARGAANPVPSRSQARNAPAGRGGNLRVIAAPARR